MYAVIETGGKQYRVQPGDQVRVERLPGEAGADVTFDKVLAVRTDEKLLTGKAAAAARVSAKIVRHGRNAKEMVMKYKKTNQYKILRGHRQDFTAVVIGDITI